MVENKTQRWKSTFGYNVFTLKTTQKAEKADSKRFLALAGLH